MVSLTEYNLRRAEAEVAFKAVMTCYNETSYRRTLGDFEQTIITPGWFKENGKITLNYLINV